MLSPLYAHNTSALRSTALHSTVRAEQLTRGPLRRQLMSTSPEEGCLYPLTMAPIQCFRLTTSRRAPAHYSERVVEQHVRRKCTHTGTEQPLLLLFALPLQWGRGQRRRLPSSACLPPVLLHATPPIPSSQQLQHADSADGIVPMPIREHPLLRSAGLLHPLYESSVSANLTRTSVQLLMHTGAACWKPRFCGHRLAS